MKLFLAIPARVVAIEPQSACHPILESRFGGDKRFTLVRAAAGASPGEADLRAADDREASVLATLSREWESRVRESGRFVRFTWDRVERVEVTTLEALIEQYGEPAFCKIDVEGFEAEVLAGLETPVRSLSLEFTPERLDALDACLARLRELGRYEFNFSLNDSLVFASGSWMAEPALRSALSRFSDDSATFGDVYARIVPA